MNPTPNVPQTYLDKLAHIESGGDPLAKNPKSTGSGLYQFLKSTWQAMGGMWGSDPTQPFGGLTPSISQQTALAAQLTANNANILQRAGVAVTDATLYAAHFLGASTAAKVLHAPPATPLASLVGQSVINANPNLRGYTVAQFGKWLQSKVG